MLTSISDAALSAVLQAVVLGGLPFLLYGLYQRRRFSRTWVDIARRAGLQVGDPRYLLLSGVVAVVGAGLLVIAAPPLEPLTRKGSAQYQFVGLGFTGPAVARAFLNGVIQTSFTEELLFRGLLTGSLARRLSLLWANLLQAAVFFVPHVAILSFAPELWPILGFVAVGALVFGWVRVRSGSILGPWLLHASANLTMALNVAIRTGP